MPEPTGSGSEAGSSTSQVTSQLAYLVPHFDPAKDDMLIYQQKVELVTAAWPKDKYVELVTRLILNCQGSAFQKLQLHQSELLSNDESSLQKLIALLGGSWGRIPLEKQFDEAEQALYHCQQKGDESNDSYLARSEILWSRFLARKLTLEDLQAFIVLRGSSLTPEDKKRVILESDRDSAGKLTSQKVSEAIRMLGANFFMDMTGQRRGKTKVYDQHALTVEDVPESADGLIAADEMTEEDFVDTLITEGEDEDAAMVADFEAAASDVIQEDLEMAQAYTAYMEARRRLSEKYRNRGFWPTSKGSNQFNKGKFSGSGGKSFGKGSKFGKGRKTLQDRILQSNCRACGRRGHWKAECPYKGGTTSQSGMSGNGSSTAPTTTLVTDLSSSGADDALPLEFLGLPTIDDHDLPSHCPVDDSWPHVVPVFGVTTENRSIGKRLSRPYNGNIHNEYLGSKGDKPEMSAKDRLRARLRSDPAVKPSSRFILNRRFFEQPTKSSVAPWFQVTTKVVAGPKTNSCQIDSTDAHICFATHGASGILDLGASKTVIGSEQVASLIDHLDSATRSQLRRCPCNITFRFGNQGTLTSSQALVIPIGNLMLKVAIVPGATPFLLSNTLMRALHASIDCRRQELQSPMFGQPVKLNLSNKGLFLINLNDITKACQFCPAQSPMQPTAPAETFVSDDAEKLQPLKPNWVETAMCTNPKEKNPLKYSGEQAQVTRTDPKSSIMRDEQAARSHNVQSLVQTRPSVLPDSNRSASDDGQSVATPDTDADAGGRASGGSQPGDAGRAESGACGLWPETPWPELSGDVERSRVGIMDGEALWGKHQDSPPSLLAIRGAEAGSPRSPPTTHSGHSTRQPAHDCLKRPRLSQSGWPKPKDDCGKGQDPTFVPKFSPSTGYGGCRMGIGTRNIHPRDYELGSHCGGDAATYVAPGKCSHKSDSPSRDDCRADPSSSADLGRRDVRCGELSSGMKEDWDTDTITFMQHEQLQLKHLIQQYEHEL